MGCLAPKQEVARDSTLTESALEEKTQTASNSDRYLESLLEKFQKIIDKEQYVTSKTIECLISLSGDNSEQSKNLPSKLSSLLPLSLNDRILRYLEVRTEATEVQYRLCSKIESYNKHLVDIINAKYHEINDRIQNLSINLKDNLYFPSEYNSICTKFSQIPKSKQTDFEYLVDKLDRLWIIDENLASIEKYFPKLTHDDYFELRVKEIETSARNLVKSSVNSIKILEEKFGVSKKKISTIVDIKTNTYFTLLDSFNDFLKELKDIEDNKNIIIENNSVEKDLEWVDNTLSEYFDGFHHTSDNFFLKLKRVTGEPALSQNFIGLIKHVKLHHQSLPLKIEHIKEKINKFLAVYEDHEKCLEKMTENFKKVEEKVDEIELKLYELLSDDLKDLKKVMSLTDFDSKTLIEDLRHELLDQNKDINKDILEHLDFVLKKLSKAMGIEIIRENIRDSQSKEINKIKIESQNKINELNIKIDSIVNEKSIIENEKFKLKATSEKASEIAENLIASRKEKEEEIVALKNKNSSLQESHDRLLEQNTLAKTEILDLTNEIEKLKRL
jgi:hypothetical protein